MFDKNTPNMGNENINIKKKRRQAIYIRPVLTFDQVAKIINERIDFMEKNKELGKQLKIKN